MSAATDRENRPSVPADRSTVPNPDTDDDDVLPELVTDQTIELLLRGAKGLVIVVNVVVMITFVMLSLGFFLHLVGASPEASFVDWVYRNTERAMQPFRGMFPVQTIDDRSVFDASLLFAAALYGFGAIALHAVVDYLSARVRRYHRRAQRAALEESRARASMTPRATESELGEPPARHPAPSDSTSE